jgi:hypothetical protein
MHAYGHSIFLEWYLTFFFLVLNCNTFIDSTFECKTPSCFYSVHKFTSDTFSKQKNCRSNENFVFCRPSKYLEKTLIFNSENLNVVIH